jgi:hypothetical protein
MGGLWGRQSPDVMGPQPGGVMGGPVIGGTHLPHPPVGAAPAPGGPILNVPHIGQVFGASMGVAPEAGQFNPLANPMTAPATPFNPSWNPMYGAQGTGWNVQQYRPGFEKQDYNPYTAFQEGSGGSQSDYYTILANAFAPGGMESLQGADLLKANEAVRGFNMGLLNELLPFMSPDKFREGYTSLDQWSDDLNYNAEQLPQQFGGNDYAGAIYHNDKSKWGGVRGAVNNYLGNVFGTATEDFTPGAGSGSDAMERIMEWVDLATTRGEQLGGDDASDYWNRWNQIERAEEWQHLDKSATNAGVPDELKAYIESLWNPGVGYAPNPTAFSTGGYRRQPSTYGQQAFGYSQQSLR